MSQFKELANNCSDSYLEMKQMILHPDTTWRRCTRNPVGWVKEEPNYVWFMHEILRRPMPDVRFSQPISNIAPYAVKALVEILESQGKYPEAFHRIAVNLLPRQNELTVPPAHTDHDFDYKHLIIYLNDSDGDTVMYNSKNQIIARSTPKEDKVIWFGKCLHSGHFPVESKERIALVATYS